MTFGHDHPGSNLAARHGMRVTPGLKPRSASRRRKPTSGIVERGIDVPPVHYREPVKYPIHKLTRWGDSMFFADDDIAGLTLAEKRSQFNSRIHAIARRRGWTVTTRRVEGGFRVWRM